MYSIADTAWSAYIKFEMRQGEIIRARGIYERYVTADMELVAAKIPS